MNTTLDIKIPDIPIEIFSFAQEEPDLTYHMRCEELWKDVRDELMDPNFRKRSHHNVGTYDNGCRGPLCRKALREHPRRRSPSGLPLQVREERIFDPVLDYFHTVMKYRIKYYQIDLLKEIS